ENPHRDQGNTLCYAVCRTANRARDVCAVAVTVIRSAAIVDRCMTCNNPPAKVVVRSPDPRVEDISFNARARCVVYVCPVKGAVSLINTVESPRSIILSCIDRNLAVLFDIFHTYVAAKRFSLFGVHLDGISVDGVCKNLIRS